MSETTAKPNWLFRASKNLAAAVAGAVFLKEIRVSSRRRRSYVLRLGYLALLTIFVAIVWINTVRYDTGIQASYSSADTGKEIIAFIATFQFIALQVIAVVVMSTAISDEIYHGTMGVLLTTPISNFQLVVGKLSSKLMQLAILVVVSIPLLSVVRVFGGVPWDYVIGSSCVTLTACAFCGAVTLFYSVLIRRAYATILASLGTIAALYLVLFIVPFLIGLIVSLASLFSGGPTTAVLFGCYPNSIGAFVLMTVSMTDPGTAATFPFIWPIHCALMLAFSFLIAMICVPLVRRVSLKKAVGGDSFSWAITSLTPMAPPSIRPVQRLPLPLPLPTAAPRTGALGYDRRLAGKNELAEIVEIIATALPLPARVAAPPLPTETPAPHCTPPPLPATMMAPAAVAPRRKSRRKDNRIDSVTGSAIVWKETRGPWVFYNVWTLVGLIVVLSIMALVATMVGVVGELDDHEYHATVISVLTGLCLIVVTVLSSTTISTEKESRALPVLLTTPLSDWHIIYGKFVGVLRRCLGSLIPIGAHLALFVVVGLCVREGFIHPIALLHMTLIIGSMLWLYISSGMYFSAKYKKTTVAVVLNMSLALVLLVLVPILSDMASLELDYLVDANPLVQAWVVTDGGSWGARTGWYRGENVEGHQYDWPSGRGQKYSMWPSTLMVLAYAAAYLAAGWLFLWRAKVNLRKNLF